MKWKKEMEDEVCIVLAYMLLEEEDANRKPRHMLQINFKEPSLLIRSPLKYRGDLKEPLKLLSLAVFTESNGDKFIMVTSF